MDAVINFLKSIKQESNEERLVRLVRLAVWAIAIIFAGWIVTKNFVPSGVYRVHYDAGGKSTIVHNFASKEPISFVGVEKNSSGEKSSVQLVTTTPLYFDIRVPRPFQSATVVLRYQNPNAQPSIRLGVRQANDVYSLRDLAIDTPLLDSLPDEWEKVTSGNTILWQKNRAYESAKREASAEERKAVAELDRKHANEKKALDNQKASGEISSDTWAVRRSTLENDYQASLAAVKQKYLVAHTFAPPYPSVAEFLAHPPEISDILEYNYNLGLYGKIQGYRPRSDPTVIDKSIRGANELVTYIGEGEKLSFDFTARSINRHSGSDSLTVELWDSRGKIQEENLDEVGSGRADGAPSPEQHLTLSNDTLHEGVYSVKIQPSDDDIFITNITSSQHLLMFKESVYLTDNEEYAALLDKSSYPPTTLYTDATAITAETSHEAGRQTISVNKRPALDIDTLHTPLSLDGLHDLSTLLIPKNDLRISGNGYFALSRDQLFTIPPQVDVFDESSDLSGISYIIASYPQPKVDREWFVATGTVEAPRLYTKDRMVRFAVIMPGLPENHRILYVKSVDITFTKPPLTPTSIIQKLWTRLTGKANKSS